MNRRSILPVAAAALFGFVSGLALSALLHPHGALRFQYGAILAMIFGIIALSRSR